MYKKVALLLVASFLFIGCGTKRQEVVYKENCKRIINIKYYRETSWFDTPMIVEYLVLEDGNEVQARSRFMKLVGELYCTEEWIPKSSHSRKGGTPG